MDTAPFMKKSWESDIISSELQPHYPPELVEKTSQLFISRISHKITFVLERDLNHHPDILQNKSETDY